jgi:hypothetical protein
VKHHVPIGLDRTAGWVSWMSEYRSRRLSESGEIHSQKYQILARRMTDPEYSEVIAPLRLPHCGVDEQTAVRDRNAINVA